MGLPLAAVIVQAVALFFARKPVRRVWVVGLTLVPLVLAFVFVVSAFVELIELDRDARVIRDAVWSWIGVGVGDAVFDAELIFRFDSLSAVFGILFIAVALAVFASGLAIMELDARADAGYQRFFVFLGLAFSSSLVFIFADNLLLLLAGWIGGGVGTAWLVGFWYSEEGSRRAATRSIVTSLVIDAALVLAVVVLFWSLASTGPHALDFGAIRESLPSLGRAQITLPFGAEVQTMALVAAAVALAAIGRAAQFPFTIAAAGIARAPAPAAAMGLINASMGVVLCCRLSFLIDASPMTGTVLAWVGGVSAIAGAAIALAQRDLIAILVAAAISQFAIAFIAVGSGAYSAAVFQIGMTLIVFTLLVLCAGSVIHTLDGERDIRRMGGLNVRLILTHLMALIGVFSPGFFLSREQALAAPFESGGMPGAGLLYAMGLIGTGLVSWAISRFLIDVFWGSIRTPLGFRGEFNDPPLSFMLPLYGLAFVSILGAAMNPAQIWGDLLQGGVEGSDSLTQFLALEFTEVAGAGIEASVRWQLVFASLLVTLVGFSTTYLFFVRFPRARTRLNRRLAPVQNVLAGRRAAERVDRAVGRPLGALSRFWLDLSVGAILEKVRRRIGVQGANLGRTFLTGLRRAERGLPDVSLLFALLGAMALLAAVLP